MNRFNVLMVTLLATTALDARIEIDRILARVNGTNILKSDLEKQRIAKEGKTFSLEEAINDELIAQHAVTMHVLPTATDIDRQFVNFKVQNGLNELSDEEFEKQLKESGFSLQEYKHQLGRLMATENVKRAEISEKIVVSTQDVEEHYKKHPEYTKEAFHLAIATVPTEEYEANGDSLASDPKLVWEDHGFIETAELNTDYEGVKNLNPGELMKPLQKEDCCELVKLIAKQEVRLKSLAERYDNIERTIQNKRKDKIVKNLEKNLRKKATIVYLD
ncbi:hypothetical protein FJ365_02455 [Candidatus Dependentiae bacterium]|nr:hypothetical protein [Candidatus Dependentiae bacterium]